MCRKTVGSDRKPSKNDDFSRFPFDQSKSNAIQLVRANVGAPGIKIRNVTLSEAKPATPDHLLRENADIEVHQAITSIPYVFFLPVTL